jgi:hypothetical protein
MEFEPPWSPYTIPRRGKAVLLDVKLVDIIQQELENSDRRFLVEAPFRTAAYARRERSVTPTDSESGETLDTSTDDEDDSASQPDTERDSVGPPDTSSEPDTDFGTTESASDMDDTSEPDLDTSEQPDFDCKVIEADSPSDDDDSDYVPSAEWSEGFIAHFSPYELQRRPPSPLLEITPMPDIFTGAHLHFMGFTRIRWNE